MVRNYLRVAFRNIFKQKGYNTLNAIGLATGIAAGLIIALHIREELSFDRQYDDYENIYRVHERGWAKSSPPMAIEMASLQQIEAVGRFAFHGSRVVTTDNNNPGEVTGYYADSSVFDVFKFPVIEGDVRHAFAVVNTAVITQSTANRYFGNESPVGKTLKFDNQQELTVVAVMQDLPENSHLKFDYLVSMATFYKDVPPGWTGSRGWMVMYTYARFRSDKEYEATRLAWPKFISRFYDGESNRDELVAQEILRFTPLKDIHLHSNLEQEMNANSSILYVYVFIAVEVLILVVACANFMSLFTTQAIKRMKEVGMRKIMGAKPGQLMAQFFAEVLLLALLSLVLAIVFYQLALPFYNSISGKSLGIWQIVDRQNLALIASLLLFIVIASGLYPAFFISRFKAGSFMKEERLPNSMPNRVRNGLVVFQFTVSIMLIASSILVQQQMTLLRNADLGFDKDQVVNIKLYGDMWRKVTSEAENVKREFLKDPDILAVGRVGNMVGDDLSVETVLPEGKESEADKYPSSRVMRVDEGYLNVMGITLLAGRNFSTAFNDSASFIINESAARRMELKDPIGQRIRNTTMNYTGTIIGVVKDYHFASLHSVIEPLIIEYKPDWTGLLTVKLRAGKTQEAMAYIRKTINTIAPNSLFVYSFLDDKLNSLYKSEDSMGKVFQFFSGLAIVIACLGLLGLAAYTIEARTKEIGIRKVLGATVGGIISLVSSRFFTLVLASFIIAVPLTWYGMHQWLQSFAYKISIEWWVFAVTGAIILVLAAAVVSFHTLSAAWRNPVKSLRYE